MAIPFFLPRLLASFSMLVALASTNATLAQQPTVEVYRVRITTVSGYHIRGILEAVDSLDVYVGNDYIPLSMIRRIVIQRESKKSALIIGALIGAIASTYLANQGLKKNPARSTGVQIVNLGFSAVGGATVGLLTGSAIGNINARVIRPTGLSGSTISLYRELRPFSVQFQRDMINHLTDQKR
ncbi:hypothetical protein [Fibrella arboris]|uniref:hypothetical protein n=1 Tax=Fibrella arboris TaxID=3242486 RepID=UPI00351FFABB